MRQLLRTALLAAWPLPSPAQDNTPFAAFDLASEAVLNDPHDLAFGPDGRLYVADKFGSRIAVFDPETLKLEGVIAEGKLPNVHDIDFGPDGRAAVAVTALGAVLVFDDITATPIRTPQFFPAPRTEGALLHSNGRLYAMAGGTGQIIAFAGSTVYAEAGRHFGAHDIAEDNEGNIWIADNAARRLVKYSQELELLQVLSHPKFGFVGPRYMDIDEFGRLVVADQDAHRILLIDPDGPDGGTLLGVLGTGVAGKGPNEFDDPEGVAVEGNRYFFADSDNNRVVRYTIVLN